MIISNEVIYQEYYQIYSERKRTIFERKNDLKVSRCEEELEQKNWKKRPNMIFLLCKLKKEYLRVNCLYEDDHVNDEAYDHLCEEVAFSLR